MSLTVDDLTHHLNAVSGGFCCPVCRESNWYVITKDNVVQETTILDCSHSSEIDVALTELIQEYGGTIPEGDVPVQQDASLLNKVVAIRCNTFGWLGVFDRVSIEEKVHG